MRLPVVPQISTKDGISNKNARLTNCLKEVKKSGEKAVVRPGLVLDDTYTGVGSGLIPFDGRLLVIYDDTVYDTTLDNSRPWELDALPWDAGTTYSIGDVIICNGVIKFSMANGNLANACNAAETTYWSTSSSTNTYSVTDTYEIGDTVVYNGVTYYSMAPSNTGNNPASTPVWSTTAPTTARYTASITNAALLLGGGSAPGPECGSRGAAAYSAFGTASSPVSCATKAPATWLWYTYSGVHAGGGFVMATQWVDAAPGDCSGSPVNFGIVGVGTITQTAA